MTLAIGARVGPYEIVAPLGAGGMGEVYRATDTKLKRQVAIKVLPEMLTADPDRLARFQREAEVLASLNHPNIAAVHGLEETSGSQALVMELVEGLTLADRIAQGAIPVAEALPIARQIAEALEAAHAHNIVHRDLKPANIKVRPDGLVKVLDFGLAKALDAHPSSSAAASASMSPTISLRATLAGVILGSAAYMSPEQARGKAVDLRTDIWAFGCVLYEMLTGRRAFEAEDISLTLAEVMKSEPDWTLLPRLPPAIGAFLKLCLKKDPKQRVQAIGDVRLALEGAFQIEAPAVAVPAAAAKQRPLWMIAIPAAAAVAIAGWAGWTFKRSLPPSTERLSVVLPASQSLAFGCLPCRSLAISPDGTHVAYVTTRPDATLGGSLNGPLHVRTLGAVADRELPSTTGAAQPFFSPDGQWIAFFTANELKKTALAGGTPIVLAATASTQAYSFGVWTEDNAIIFGDGQGLWRVSDQGGTAERLTTVDAQNEARHGGPDIVPGGAVLFTVMFRGQRPPRIEALMLQTKERRVVLENASYPQYLLSGHLLFQRDDGVLVAPFDPARLTLTGTAVPLVDEVRRDGPNGDGAVGQLAVSRTGTLAYVPAGDTQRVLGKVSRTGAFERLEIPPDRFRDVAVAPDGESVAFGIGANSSYQSEVRVHDLARGTTTRLTQPGVAESQPAWRRDGRALAVTSVPQVGSRRLMLKELGGAERPLQAGPGNVRDSVPSWSPDGTLAYVVNTPLGGTATDIWVTSAGDDASPRAWLTSPAGEFSPAFSPDGRWVAYVSAESGRNEVYVRPYPQGDRIPVSTAGGGGPVWRRDGKELFLQSSVDGVPKLMVVSVAAEGNRLQFGRPVPLFDLRVSGPTGAREQYSSSSIVGRRWDVFPDGQHFLMVRGADPQGVREIVLVQHWDEELKRVAPLP